jgi:hypothetical protein
MELKSFSSHFQEGTVGLKKTDLFTITQLINILSDSLQHFFPQFPIDASPEQRSEI